LRDAKYVFAVYECEVGELDVADVACTPAAAVRRVAFWDAGPGFDVAVGM
jgi:hypothetical protein